MPNLTDPKIFQNITKPMKYRASYTKKTFTVVWKNWDGSTLKTETVTIHDTAVPPAAPSKVNATFTGWFPSNYSNITGNIEIIAQFSDAVTETFTVLWVDWNGQELKKEVVAKGGASVPPTEPSRFGYTFTGWSHTGTNITSDTTIWAQYKAGVDGKFLVSWMINDVPVKQEYLAPGSKAEYPDYYTDILPNVPEGKVFMGWRPTSATYMKDVFDKLDNIQDTITIKASLEDDTGQPVMTFLINNKVFYVIEADNTRLENEQSFSAYYYSYRFSECSNGKIFKGWSPKLQSIKVTSSKVYNCIIEDMVPNDIVLLCSNYYCVFDNNAYSPKNVYYEIDDTIIDYTKMVTINGTKIKYIRDNGVTYNEERYALTPHVRTADIQTGKDMFLYVTGHSATTVYPSITITEKDNGLNKYYELKSDQVNTGSISVKVNGVTAKFKYECRDNPELIIMPCMYEDISYNKITYLESKGVTKRFGRYDIISFAIEVLEETGMKQCKYRSLGIPNFDDSKIFTASSVLVDGVPRDGYAKENTYGSVMVNKLKSIGFTSTSYTAILLQQGVDIVISVNPLTSDTILPCTISTRSTSAVTAYTYGMTDDNGGKMAYIRTNLSDSSYGYNQYFQLVDPKDFTNADNIKFSIAHNPSDYTDIKFKLTAKNEIATENYVHNAEFVLRMINEYDRLIGTIYFNADLITGVSNFETVVRKVTWYGPNGTILKEEYVPYKSVVASYSKNVEGYVFMGWERSDNLPLTNEIVYDTKIYGIYIAEGDLE